MIRSDSTYLELQNITVGYKSGDSEKRLISNFSVEVGRALITGIIGPNGSGKSTLIRSLLGITPLLNGNIKLMGKDANKISSRKKAAMISYVAASDNLPGNITVRELVTYGRYPYKALLSGINKDDKKNIENAMQQMQVNSFADKQISEISDGEKQRCMIARALSQDTPLIILDEPSAHLDIKNRYELMKFLKIQAENFNKSIIFSSHDLEIILNHTDQLWMIDNGKMTTGMPEELVLNGKINSLVPSDDINFDSNSGKFNLPVIKRAEICIDDNSIAAIWTKHALNRYGFKVNCNKNAKLSVSILEIDNSYIWELKTNDETIRFDNLNKLILKLKDKVL